MDFIAEVERTFKMLDGAVPVSYTHLRKLLPLVGNVFSIYDLSDDNFALSPDYDLLYTELTGAVVLYIEEYGV